MDKKKSELPLKLSKKNKSTEEFLKELNSKYGIAEVAICFEGSGDSGEIDMNSLELLDSEGVDLEGYGGNSVKLTEAESNILGDIFDKYLASTEYDWYNNDGGYGDIYINLLTGKITCNMHIRITDTEDHKLEDEGKFIKNFKLLD